jgi:peptidoglycan/LPS O-acetylase OafA/YrhL
MDTHTYARHDSDNRPIYRPEIDGLRTVAIVPVVLFHAGLTTWSGGFVGVDVFFVISGYLITSIIVSEISSGTFTYGRFYERRIRRLAPPLLAMLVVTWTAATILLDPAHYEEFSQSFLSVLTATSNWFFFSQIDYFDGDALSKPLLHMWSLAIEEQFYIVFPAILIVLKRKVPTKLVPALAAIATVSFGYAAYLIMADDANNAFYNSLARFWELLVGCLLAVGIAGCANIRAAVWARYIGALMIGVAVLGYHEGLPFPGPTAVVPVLGTALIIWAGTSGKDMISNVLKSEPFVQVGRVSYAWYLFHWPIAVFVPLLFPIVTDEYSPLPQLAGAVVGLGLAFLSLRYLENPIRRKTVLPSRRGAYGLFATALAASIILALPGLVPALAIYRLETVFGPHGAILATLKAEDEFYKEHFNLNFNGKSQPLEGSGNQDVTCSYDLGNTPERLVACLTQQASDRNVLIIGDSVGRDTFHSLKQAFPQTNFLMLHQSSCVPADVVVARRHCFSGILDVLDRAKAAINIEAVVLAFRYRAKEWTSVSKGLAPIRERFGQIYMVGVTPVFRAPPAVFVRRSAVGDEIQTKVLESDKSMVPWSYEKISAAARKLAEKHQITYIDVEPVFCPGEVCRLWLDDDVGKPLFWDQFHLTSFGIEYLAERLRDDASFQPFLGTDQVEIF